MESPRGRISIWQVQAGGSVRFRGRPPRYPEGSGDNDLRTRHGTELESSRRSVGCIEKNQPASRRSRAELGGNATRRYVHHYRRDETRPTRKQLVIIGFHDTHGFARTSRQGRRTRSNGPTVRIFYSGVASEGEGQHGNPALGAVRARLEERFTKAGTKGHRAEKERTFQLLRIP